MAGSWNYGVRGTQVLPLINSEADTLRCVAGPGSGKTFGLVRRVVRLLHPEGLGVDGRDVLVVAFNRVIARQLRDDIQAELKKVEHQHEPVIRTIHALCVEVIGEELRMLLPHEVEAMICDVQAQYPAVAALYDNFYDTLQALRDHEANHAEHIQLWQAARQWLVRHKAHLVSDLPRLLLERLKGGDFPDQGYDFVIVDEFQDLTPGEQELMLRLRRHGGQLVALGDPRQSIYMFRGNDRKGLAKLDTLLGDRGEVTDVSITECQRCPKPIVTAANQLMALSGVEQMVPVSEDDLPWATGSASHSSMVSRNSGTFGKNRDRFGRPLLSFFTRPRASHSCTYPRCRWCFIVRRVRVAPKRVHPREQQCRQHLSISTRASRGFTRSMGTFGVAPPLIITIGVSWSAVMARMQSHGRPAVAAQPIACGLLPVNSHPPVHGPVTVSGFCLTGHDMLELTAALKP